MTLERISDLLYWVPLPKKFRVAVFSSFVSYYYRNDPTAGIVYSINAIKECNKEILNQVNSLIHEGCGREGLIIYHRFLTEAMAPFISGMLEHRDDSLIQNIYSIQILFFEEQIERLDRRIEQLH